MNLRDFPLFSGLSAEDAVLLQRSASLRKFPTGTRIFDDGEPALGFYLVLQGAVKIFKLSPRGQEQIVAVMTAGDSFAEAAVFLGKGYPASAECIQDSKLLFIDREALVRQLAHDPELALRMMAGMAIKLRRLVSMVEDLTLRDARGRLCRYLLGLIAPPQLPTSRVVLARLLGLSGETLSRTLRTLKDEGILDISRAGHVKIHSPEALREAAGDTERIRDPDSPSSATRCPAAPPGPI